MGEQITQSEQVSTTANPHVPGQKSRAREMLRTVSMTLPIIGAVGTGFVWIAANFYVGDVEVVSSTPVRSIVIDAFNKRGQSATFHTQRFQLMPGAYHLEVTAEGRGKVPADVDVEFGKTKRITVNLARAPITAPSAVAAVPATPHQSAEAAGAGGTTYGASQFAPLDPVSQNSEATPANSTSNTTRVAEQPTAVAAEPDSPPHHRWWQFWRKKNN